MSIYILVRGLTEGVSLKKVILSPCWLFSSWEIPPIRFILIPFIQKRRVFTFCECLSIFSLFLSGDETTNLAQKNSFSYLGTSSSTFNRNNTPRIFADYWRNYCWIRIFVYLSQRYQRLSMTAFLIALIGFTTLALLSFLTISMNVMSTTV